MKESIFYTDSGPTCRVSGCARPGYGCWRYHVRQYDGEKVIVVKAICYICHSATYFEAEVETDNLNDLTAAEVHKAHSESAMPILEGQWRTWAYRHLGYPTWFCPFCKEILPHYEWWEGKNFIRQCQKCGVTWTRYDKPLK